MRLAGLFAICALSCCPRPSPPPARIDVAVGPLDPRRFLGEAATRARALGAGELEPVGAALVSDGDQLGSFVTVPADQCVLAIARASATVRDVDLFLFDDAGDPLAADESPQASAAVMVCPPHDKRLYVAARTLSGTGVLAIGVMPVPPGQADAVARALAVRGRPGEDTGKLAAWPGLETKLRERRQQLGASWQDVRRASVTLDPHAASATSITVDAGRCVDVFATPSEEVRSLDFAIVDATGRVVARGKPPGPDQGAVVCSSEKQDVTVMLRPRISQGSAALVVARTAVGASAELTERVVVAGATPVVALGRALELHRARLAKLAWGEMKSASEGRARVGAPGIVDLTLARGCNRIDVIGGTPLGAFAVELWSESGELIDRASGGDFAALFACVRAEVKARVEVATAQSAGPFAAQVRNAAAKEVLLTHPLATARVLARLEAEEGLIDLTALDAIEEVSIPSGVRLERAVAVAGGCASWIAASEEDEGLVAELLDEGGERRGLARGDRLLSVAACEGKELRGTLRLRTGAGAARVLLLPRHRP